MRQSSLKLCLLLALGMPTPLFAIERGPVCREPSVIDEITREVRRLNYYSSIDPKLVTEQGTADPRIVQCQVCVESAPYETLRYGDQPIRQCLPRGFEVRILTGGFVVRDLR